MPEEPENFRSLGITSDSITLAWDPPSGTNTIISYDLYYEIDNSRSARVKMDSLYNMLHLLANSLNKLYLNQICLDYFFPLQSANKISLGLVVQYTLTGLSSGTSYKVSVTSKSSNGEESVVTSIAFSTKELGRLKNT